MKMQIAIVVCLVSTLLFVGAGSSVVIKDYEEPAEKVFYEPQGAAAATVEGSPGEKKVIVNWCSICVALVEWLDAHVINETERGLFFLFDKVCNALPASVRTDCFEVTDQLIPVITELLLEELIPIKVCTLLTVCDVSDLENHGDLRGDDGVPNMNQQGALKEIEVELVLQRFADKACALAPYKYYALCREALKTDTLQKMTSLIQPRK